MAARLESRIVRPEQLSRSDRERLIHDLYSAHCQVFSGVSREAFVKYVIESPADETAIKVFTAPAAADTRGRLEREIVGYVAVHAFERQLSGRDCTVVRVEAGLDRRYRGGNLPAAFIARQVVRRQLRHPRRPIYYLGALVHPSSYTALARSAAEIWPCHDRETPAHIAAFMAELADSFGLDAVDPRLPLVRRVGWATRDTAVEGKYWRTCENPAVRFFIEQNPGYANGDGLVTLVPMSAGALGRGLVNLGRARARKQLHRWRSAAQKLTGGDRASVTEVVAQLGQTHPFSGLSHAALTTLAGAAYNTLIPAGQWVFHQGDRGDAAYLICKGSAYVLVGATEPELVDQLGVGDVFGAIAAVTGAPRTAGIRAASDLHVLRLDATAIRHLMKDAPEMTRPLWDEVARCRLDDVVREMASLASIDREQRRRWCEHGTAFELDEHEFRGAPGGCYLLVYDGVAEARIKGRIVGVSAPSLLSHSSDVEVRGVARALVLPEPPGAVPSGAGRSKSSCPRAGGASRGG